MPQEANMATTDNAVQYDVRMVQELLPYLNLNKKETSTLIKFTEMGIVQRETVAELAMSNVGSFDGDSSWGRDFTDGSDAKTVTSNARNNDKKRGSWTNSFEIRNVATKTGDLRIMAYNKILDKFHYFYIPNEAFLHLKSTLTIVIESYTCHIGEPEFTGKPNRSNKFWEYEVDSFEDLCLSTSSNIRKKKAKSKSIFNELFE
jgi:hypothetical protein